MKVYVLIEPDSSPMHYLHGVFMRRSQAEAYITRYNKGKPSYEQLDDSWIEEAELDTGGAAVTIESNADELATHSTR